MKLQCQVEIINRTLSNLNMRTNSKYLKSTLALGKEPKSGIEYFILHFSTVNKSGTKYRVKHIKNVFVKYLNDGKTTIRFEEPPHDLCIKSEVIQLKCFMRLLKLCITGDEQALKLASLSNLSVTAKDNAPTKLIIHDRSQFPKNGLPRTLESLSLSGLKLCNFRRDILLLKQLTILNLSDNEIEKLPPEFGRMPCLTELHLANNQLGKYDTIDWRWLLGPQITKSLKLLDLSGNKILYLPNDTWRLQNLVTLKLDNNQLQRLPATVSRIGTLRYLTVSRNQLKSLSYGLIKSNLEYIDISGNNFEKTECESTFQEIKQNVETLVTLSAEVVLNKKIYYAPNIIPRTLVYQLDAADTCICGGPVMNKIHHYREVELKNYVSQVVFDDSSRGTVGIDFCICSRKCYLGYCKFGL